MSVGKRGQSEVLGAVLLLGIVLMASLTVAGVALSAFGGTQDQAEDRAIEQMMLDLRSAATDVGINGLDNRTLSLDPPSDAQITLEETSSRITIVHRNYTGGEPDADEATETLYDESFGSFEVATDERRYAFEGGGVFREQDNYSRLVAAPPVAYRGLTANLAVIKLEGTADRGGPVTLELRPGNQTLPEYPNRSKEYAEGSNRYDNPVENGTLEITVQSDYYQGWYQFFTQRTTGSTTIDHANRSVTVALKSLTELQHFNAITAQGEISTNGQPTINGSAVEGEYIVDSRSIIDSEVSDASNESDSHACIGTDEIGNCSSPLPAGTYYLPDDTKLTNESFDIDTTGGDVKIVIDGNFALQDNEITVIGDADYGVTYYVNGSLRFDGGAKVGTANDPPEAHRNAFVIANGLDENDQGGQDVELDAIIYAPNADVNINGKFTLRGALYANSVQLGGGPGSTTIEYDPAIDDDPLDLHAGSTPIMFLHITENNVVVDVS